MNEAGRPLVGARSGPWCELLERVTRELRPGTAYAVRALLMTLCERLRAADEILAARN